MKEDEYRTKTVPGLSRLPRLCQLRPGPIAIAPLSGRSAKRDCADIRIAICEAVPLFASWREHTIGGA